MARTLYLIFFASGATGLVYEIIWMRLTGLVFGNTSFSIATVLGAFMAGLALGSWLLGALADRMSRPLRTYGILEILIGVSAVLVPTAFRSMDSVYWGLAPTLQSVPGGDLAVRFLSSFLIMLVPTFLMGGTLPVLSRFFVRRPEEVEAKLGLLYALNTAGAAIGTLVAALVLIPGLGAGLTTVWVGALNVILGLLAIRLDLRHGRTPTQTREEPGAEPYPESVNDGSADRIVLAALGVSGFAAMAYEVSWTRSLTALIGSSTYAFAIMLVTFLIGIAAGSSWAGRFRPRASLRMLGVVQLCIALGGLVFLVGYLFAPYLLVALIRALYYSFPAVLTIQFMVSFSLMISATFFMGAMFPIGAQLYSNRPGSMGRRIGGIYSVNTFGAILGSLAAGFVLVPSIGTERTILIGLLLNSAVAVYLLWEMKGRNILRWVGVALLLLSTGTMWGGVFWSPGVLDRGVLIYARQFDDRPGMTIDEHYADSDVVYFEEGNNATISVRRGNNYIGLRTNGKVDASNGNDMTTQLLMAYLPGLYDPSPEHVLVIGYGSGVTAGAATVFPETTLIECVEIEPAMFGAGRFFGDLNRQSYAHPKVRLIEADARNYLNETRETYDVIISEPSNPWIAGVGSLFTAEFYERAAQALEPDGVFAQWVQLYELSPEDVRMVLGEFQRQFPEVLVWDMGVGDLVLLGSREPLRFDADRLDAIFAGDPSVRRDFQDYLELKDPLGLFSHYLLSGQEIAGFTAGARRNTDDHPLLEFDAPRNLFSDTWNLNVAVLREYGADILPAGLTGAARERAYVAIVEPLIRGERLDAAAQALRELSRMDRVTDVSLLVATARVNIATERYPEARTALEQADVIAAGGSAYAADRAELWSLLSQETGDFPLAIQHIARAASLAPNRPVYLRRLAELYALSGEWGDAAEWLTFFVETKPRRESQYWELLGGYLSSAGREAEAIDAFRTALEIEPYSYVAPLRLAEVEEAAGHPETAIALLEPLSAYAIDRDPELYIRLVGLYQEVGRSRDAHRMAAKGRRIFPNNVDIYKLNRDLNVY
jgi:spermidine synthase